MRNVALAAGLLLSACGSTLAGASPSPQGSATVSAPSPSEGPAATPGLAGALPGSVVRITVNGAPYDQSLPFQLKPTGSPVVIQLSFPFAVDRSAIETWLPRSAVEVWTDDRTIRLTYPGTETNIGFKIPETRAADGSATIGLFIVRVGFPASRLISIYTIAELTDGARVPTPATSVRVSAPGLLRISPDGLRAIAAAYQPNSPPLLVDLTTRTSAPLSAPDPAEGPFVFAGWLADGRLLIVGRSVWLGDRSGAAIRKVADVVPTLGAPPTSAVPSPSSDRVALSTDDPDGHVAVVDLRTGSVARISGPFRRVRSQAAVSLAWSKDGALLAGTDADAETAAMASRVRIVDLRTGRTLRTIEGDAVSLSSLPTNELLIVRESDRIREYLGLVVGFDGAEHRRYTGGGAWWMSPDGAFLLQQEPSGGAGYPALTLIDLASGRSHGLAVQSPFAGWLVDDRLAFADGR